MSRLRQGAADLLDQIAPSLGLALRARLHLRRGEEELAVARQLVDPSKRSIDVGANRGIYSYWFQSAGGPVTAIEPFPDCVALLRRSFGPQVEVVAAACSDTNGTANLTIPGAPSSAVSYRATLEQQSGDQLTAQEHTIEVKTRRLDDLVTDPVGIMKIDVEGHEQEVLAGAEQLVDRDRPVVVIEVEERHRAGAPAAVLSWFDQRDYVGFFLGETSMCSAATFNLEQMQRTAADGSVVLPYVNNFIFVPAENTAARETVENIGAR